MIMRGERVGTCCRIERDENMRYKERNAKVVKRVCGIIKIDESETSIDGGKHMRESVLELDEKVNESIRNCPSMITKCKKKPKNQVSETNRLQVGVTSENSTYREVNQARGGTHRGVASCTRLFLEKDEKEERRSSAKEYSGVSRSARR